MSATAFAGRKIHEPAGAEHKCPRCDTPTEPSLYGRVACCLPCTEAEVGETYEQIRDRAIKSTTKQQKKRGRRS